MKCSDCDYTIVGLAGRQHDMLIFGRCLRCHLKAESPYSKPQSQWTDEEVRRVAAEQQRLSPFLPEPDLQPSKASIINDALRRLGNQPSGDQSTKVGDPRGRR